MSPTLQSLIAFAAILGALMLERALGLVPQGVHLATLGFPLCLAAIVKLRWLGLAPVALAYAVSCWLAGASAAITAADATVYTAAATAAGFGMRWTHKRGMTATQMGRWLAMLLSGALPAALATLLGRSLARLLQGDPAALLHGATEALGVLLGVLCGVAVTANLAELRDRHWLSRDRAVIVLGSFTALALYLSTGGPRDQGINTSLLVLLGFPLTTLLSTRNSSLVGGVTVWLIVLAITTVAAKEPGNLASGNLTLLTAYFAALVLSGQYVHQMNRDRLGLLAENRRAANELEQRVLERTAKLAEMTEQARAADRAKGEFLAMMSHELRTPMNGVVGMTDMLIESGLSGRQTMFVEVIRKSSISLLTLIGDILDFSQINAGKLTLEERSFDTASLLGGHLTPITQQALARGVSVTLFIDPALPLRMLGDLPRLRQATAHIVGNAVKFTERGEIEARAERVTRDGVEMVRIGVRDTGPGVPAPMREAVFERFRQVDGRIARAHQGAGLGLALSKGIVEAAGGRIGCEAAPSGGALFWFELPLKDAGAGAIAEALAARHRGQRALIAHENPAEAEAVGRFLRAGGVACDLRADIEAARADAARGGYDIAISTDAALLRETDAAWRVLALDPNAAAAAEESDLAGLTVLAKPFSPAELLRALAASEAAPAQARAS